MSATGHSITYEGSVHVGPGGADLVLDDTRSQDRRPLALHELVVEWLAWHTGYIPEGAAGPVRVTVQYLGDRRPQPRQRPEPVAAAAVDLVGLAGVRVSWPSPIDMHEDAPGPEDPDVLPPAP
jgi:hypothetical protein